MGEGNGEDDGSGDGSEQDRLAEYRVWMVEQFENEVLVGDYAPDVLAGVTGHVEGLNKSLALLDGGVVAGFDGDALMGAVLALEDVQRRLDAVNAVTFLRQVVATVDADDPEPDCGDRDTAVMGS